MHSPLESHAHEFLVTVAPAPLVKHSEAVHEHVLTTLHCTDPDILSAALLHDLIEDTDVTHEQLAELFSPTIADLVREVSHAKNPTKEDYDHYHLKLQDISPEAQLIKIADELTKLESFKRRYNRYRTHLHEQKIFTSTWAESPALTTFREEWEKVAKLYNAQ